MFDADHPITSHQEDRLNRTTFAKYLARCMLDHHDSESTVIGLDGSAGSGKTSVINLVLEELQFAASNIEDPEKPIIINFNPWNYSGQHQLSYHFFRFVAATLRATPYLKENDQLIHVDELIHLLETYAAFFMPESLPMATDKKLTWIEKWTVKNANEEETIPDLMQIKAELNASIMTGNHQLIVIIDNISRLQDAEIQQIFQLVKSLGDFSNTIYLLAFDKTEVIHAMNRIHDEHGETFLEKIIQLPFSIPVLEQEDLEAILIDRLSEMVKEVPDDAWSVDYWAQIYHSGFRYFFKSIRDITRYINTLKFSYHFLKEVVNPVDFFALTAIEVFLPDIYAAIRDNKDLFTDLLEHVYRYDDECIQKDRMRANEILSHNKRFSNEALSEFLLQLFPRLRKIYKPTVDFFYSDALARKLKNLSSPDVFDIYFRLSLQQGQIPDSEFKTILTLASEKETFDQVIAGLNKDERIIPFLSELDSHVLEQIPKKDIANIIIALFDHADLFPKGLYNTLSLDTFSRIHRIVLRLLQRLEPTERYQVLQSAISEMKNSLWIAVYELGELGKERDRLDDTLPQTYSLLSDSELALLKETLLERIRFWAHNGRLAEHPQLLQILYAWHDWEGEIECEKYVKQLVSTDPGLVTFLMATLEKPIADAITEYSKKPDWEESLNYIATFVPVDSLKKRAREIFEDGYFEKLREKEQLAIIIYLDLIKAKTNKIIPKTTV